MDKLGVYARIILLFTLVILAYSPDALAQQMVPPSQSEMAAIYEHFGTTPSDPAVFEIRGSAVTEGEYPRHLTGFLTSAPYLFEETMCVLETLKKSGEIIDSKVIWEDGPPSKSLRVWLFSDPNDCIGIKPEQLPTYVYVNSPKIGLDVILRILQCDDVILRRAENTPDGEVYGNVTAFGFRMTDIKPARKDLKRDLGDYCVKYDAPNASMGPSICFKFEDDELVLKSVGYWIS